MWKPEAFFVSCERRCAPVKHKIRSALPCFSRHVWIKVTHTLTILIIEKNQRRSYSLWNRNNIISKMEMKPTHGLFCQENSNVVSHSNSYFKIHRFDSWLNTTRKSAMNNQYKHLQQTEDFIPPCRHTRVDLGIDLQNVCEDSCPPTLNAPDPPRRSSIQPVDPALRSQTYTVRLKSQTEQTVRKFEVCSLGMCLLMT